MIHRPSLSITITNSPSTIQLPGVRVWKGFAISFLPDRGSLCQRIAPRTWWIEAISDRPEIDCLKQLDVWNSNVFMFRNLWGFMICITTRCFWKKEFHKRLLRKWEENKPKCPKPPKHKSEMKARRWPLRMGSTHAKILDDEVLI